MQREREREKERDVHDFLVNPWNKNVYFVRMSIRYKTQKRRQSKPRPRSSCLLDSSCSTFRQNLKWEINRHWKWVSFLWNIQRVKWVMNKQTGKKINVWSDSLLAKDSVKRKTWKVLFPLINNVVLKMNIGLYFHVSWLSVHTHTRKS